MTDVLFALAGVGLVLSGLRGLVTVISDAAATRIRESVLPWLERTPVAVLSGAAGTVLMQASAITVMVMMAAVHRGVMGIETAVLVMLGATVGTALKTWLFAWPVDLLGPALVSVGSFTLLAGRGLRYRRMAEVVLYLGLVYLGWSLCASAAGPWLTEPAHQEWVRGMDLSRLGGLAAVITAGLVAAFVVQSSSAVVLLVTGLVAAGQIGVGPAAALVLGANVGTAFTPILASVEYRSESRVVAFVHLVVKASGVLVVSLFFRTFLQSVGAVATAVGVSTPEGQVLMAHSLFNLVNAAVWLPLAPFLARRLIGPADERRSVPFLARSVRRMLARLPEEASVQIQQERDRCLRESKIFLDALMNAASAHTASTLKPPYDLRSRVIGAQELVAEVAVRGDDELDPRFQRHLSELNTLEDLIDELIGLVRRLELESSRVRMLRAVRLSDSMAAYRESIAKAWAAVVHADRKPPKRGDFAHIERAAYQQLQAAGRIDEADWMELSHQLAILQRVWNRVMDLVVVTQQARKALRLVEEEAG